MKRYILLALLIVVAANAVAQGRLSRQVEVTRDYTPDVDKASKKDVPPTMYDTVKLNPEIRYSITATPSASAIKIDTIAAAGIGTNTFSPGAPLFVRLGAGYPFNSLADIYYSKIYEDRTNWGAYFNHDGYWGKLKNDMGNKLSAKDYALGAGAFADVKVGSRYAFESDIEFTHRGVDKYGVFAIEGSPLTDYGTSTTAAWNDMGINLAFGSDMRDLSRFGFRVEAGGYLLMDNSENKEYSYRIKLDGGKSWGRNTVKLSALWLATAGIDGYIDGYDDQIITLAPRYERKGDKYDLAAGVDVTVNNSKVWIFPHVKLTWNVARGSFVPYVEARGGLTQNSYRSTLAQNPYVRAGLVMPNTANYLVLAGVSGNINARFSYKAYAGFDFLKHSNWFTNIYTEGATNEFGYVTSGGSLLKIGGAIDWFASPSLRAEVGVDYIGFSFTDIPTAFGLPNLSSDIKLTYLYRSRFEISALGLFQTPRKFYAVGHVLGDGVLVESKTNSTFDLGLRAKYNLRNNIGIFFDATNLLGAQLYPYGHYVGRGATITAGVMLRF